VSSPYWGVFEALLNDASAGAREVRPYHGVAAQLYDQLNAQHWDDTEYTKLAAECGGPVLDLGCGTGRVSLELATSGHNVVALDLSEEMLALFRSKLYSVAPQVRNRVTILCDNAATVRLDKQFKLVLLLNFTLGLMSPDEQVSVLRSAVEHLTANGIFAFDYMTILDRNAPSLAGNPIDREFSLAGRPLAARLGVKYMEEIRSLVANVAWNDSKNGVGGPALMSLPVRTFEPAEIDQLLADAGLVLIRRRSEDFDDFAVRRTLVTCGRRSLADHPLWHPYHGQTDVPWAEITLTEGSGCEVADSQGKRYLDASGGLWSVSCGLGRTEIVEAVTTQLQRLSYGTLFMGRSNLPAVELAQRLVSLTKAPLDHVYLTGSGSESVELAIKLARTFFELGARHTKKGILYFEASYHGTFFGSIGVSGLAPEQRVFEPGLPGLCAMPTPLPQTCPDRMTYEQHADRCANVFERMLDQASDNIAAFIFEPVLGSAGVIIPPKAYFERIQRACRNHNVLLIADEVATGCGRTGRWFASEHYGLRPDMMLLGKGINSGYLPLGAVVFSTEIAQRLVDAKTGIVHGSSHNGNPACCSAALATLNILQRDGLVDRARDMGTFFVERLRENAGVPGLGSVRGVGLMIFAGLRDDDGSAANLVQVLAICEELQRRGVLVHPALDGVMFFPPFVITHDQIDMIVSSLVGVLRDFQLVEGTVVARKERPTRDKRG
jgi:adenosylmethionine-8-amino-7-oxononanoate aminotransferase/SAM-dependent methyltransferase